MDKTRALAGIDNNNNTIIKPTITITITITITVFMGHDLFDLKMLQEVNNKNNNNLYYYCYCHY